MILPNIFSKFVVNCRDGLGLGLYLTKNVINRHGGKVWAKNNENGKCAMFWLSLPVS